MTLALQVVLLRQLAGIFAPVTAITSADNLAALLDRAGWDLDALPGVDVAAAVTASAAADVAVGQLVAAIEAGGDELADYAGAALSFTQAATAVLGAVEQWAPPSGLAAADLAQLPADLMAFLLDSYVREAAPRAAAVLQLLGVLTTTDEPAITRSDGTVARRAMARPRVDLAVLGRLTRDPVEVLRERFLQDPAGARRVAEDVADLVGPLLVEVVDALGALGSYGVPDEGGGLGMTADELAAGRHMLLARYDAGAEAPSDVVAAVTFLLAAGLTDDTGGRGLGLVLAPSGGLDVTAGPVRLTLVGDPGTILVTGSGAEAETAGASLTVGLSYTPPADPVARFGSPAGTRFEVGSVTVTVTGVAAADDVDLVVTMELRRIVVAVAAGDGDGFLAKVLPSEPVESTADLVADWSPRTGLQVRGSGGLELRIPAHLAVGPLVLDEVVLAAGIADTGVTATVAVTATLALGPFVATLDGVGLRAAVNPGDRSVLAVGFKPPTGIGFALDTGAVSGGGLVSIDEPAHQYVGILYLDIAGVVTVTAIGILTTRMPDGSDGFSLLILITAEFPPIQLGYGFALTGLGGLVGVNRTFDVEVLRAGVRTGALGAILFPTDPVAHAAQLIATLKSVFPPAAGRFVFGPMIKIGWGPNSLLSAELGLLLELPAPLRLVVVGKIMVVLPDPRIAVVALRLDVLGVLDLAKGEVSIDASLIDSRIAVFPVTGDMALRVGWQATKGFALAVGGFHPRFTPPPGFPELARLAISLASGDDPLVRVEAYFAVTANSIQFGGRVDLSVREGPFGARGFAGLDALVQLQPFHFVFTLGIGIDITWDGAPLLHAHLEAILEGPNPWHVRGHVEFQVLLLSGSIGVDLTIGSAVEEEPQRVDLGELLRTALLADDAWSGELPPGGGAGVSLRSLDPVAGLIVHPLGRFSVRQRALPLELPITRYGAARPAPNTSTTFAVTSLSVGGSTLPGRPLTDDFAAGQFVDLSDDERLSRPGFEAMPSGATSGMPRYRWPVDAGGALVQATVELAYDEAVVNADEPLAHQRRGVRLDAALGARIARDGPAGHSAARAAVLATPDNRVVVVGERFVAGPPDAIPGVAGATSSAQAAASRKPGERLVSVGEVA